MKITKQEIKIKTFFELKPGTVFEWDKQIWLKTTTLNNAYNCINLTNNSIDAFGINTPISIIYDAELILRGNCED